MFSTALENYVGHVLPSLGLHNIGIVTFRSWLAEQRKRHFPSLPGSDRIDTPTLVQALKLHPLLGLALELQVERVAASVAGSRRSTTGERAHDRVGVAGGSGSQCAGSVQRRRATALRRLESQERRRDPAVLAGDREARAELDAEDDALLLRAWQLRVGPLRGNGRKPLRYRHVVLDEVQDFSPLEVRLLLDCMQKNASITLAGDTQQHLSKHGGFTSWQDFLSNLGIAGKELKTLRINYRSSIEITRFAFGLLGAVSEEPDAPEATRAGPPVEVFRFDDRGACVFFLAEALRSLAESEPLASVAVADALARAQPGVLRRARACGSRAPALDRRSGLQLCGGNRGHRDRAGEGARVRLRDPRSKLDARELPRRYAGCASADCTSEPRARSTSSGSRPSAHRRR